jgi:hypothetical protein
MNRLLPLGALVLSLTALTVALLGRDTPPLPPASAPAPELATGPTQAQFDAWARRVEALEVTTLSLARRAAALERGAGLPPAAEGPAASPPPAEAAALAAQVQQLREEVQGLIVGEAMTSPGGRAQLKAAVQEAQAELVRERIQTRQQQAAQARQERLQRFFREARLSSSQERELTQLLDSETQRTQALRDQGLRGRERREALRSVRTETDTAAAHVLDAQQRTAYELLRREEGPDGRPRGREAAAPSP